MLNKRGADHSWGSNHPVWGKPVIGGRAIGDFIDNDDADHWTGGSRLSPKVAEFHVFATLARRFGLADEEIASRFPTLVNFS